ncbi:LytR/AlgR family response regulator transcription factor [[Clostridium] fimetarium]|uniref:Stage 0 sporulation protein A homolog n=1 Tax=[Clostridium] fimetarium TaxID=99656 RepID=A0A1I0R5Y9_9FIRM|nr:LytTR family DNA-binding domain-containing protein [[Clostridium] fimetarium]SEW36004.1 DNA-binding response regulator, LytR/AlgR family [[Clostridium] fimetarium]
MIKIAICDDDAIISEQLQKMIYSMEEFLHEEFHVDIFIGGMKLYEELKKGTEFHAIFLDIEMPDMDGIDVGRKIREEFHDEITQIIYISSQSSYAMQLFKVRPMDFLIKPLDELQVKAVVTKAYNLIKTGNEIFPFVVGRETIRKPISKILYFQSRARKVIMYTTDETYEFYCNLGDIYEQLKANKFFFIHKSYLVNYNHISRLGYEALVMTDGTQLEISQSKRKEVRELHAEFERRV